MTAFLSAFDRHARAVFLIAAVAYLAIPIFLSTRRDWLAPPVRGLGLGLLLTVFAAYAWRGAAGVWLARDARALRLRPTDVALLVALPLYLLLVGNGLRLSSADNMPTVLLGPVLLKQGTFDLSGIPEYQTRRRLHYSAVRVGERILPAYPLGTAVASVPYVALTGLVQPRGDPGVLAQRRDKHLAALMTVASAVLLFLGVRPRHGEVPALAAAFLFAAGTTVLSSSGQSLWSFTGELLFVTTALWLLLPGSVTASRGFAAGLAAGAAVACRPTAVLVGAAMVILSWPRRRPVLAYLAGFSLAMAGSMLMYLYLYGHPLGGYGLTNGRGRWGAAVAEGLVGTLVNPSRGALLFFPYLCLVPLGWPAVRADRRLGRVFAAAAAACLTVYVLVSVYDEWWGGKSIGPRLTTELAPFFALLMVPVFGRWRDLGRRRALVVAALAFAVGTQVLSAYTTRGYAWTARVDTSDAWQRWSPGRSQLLALWCPSCVIPPAP
jgi:hypothetical protein